MFPQPRVVLEAKTNSFGWANCRVSSRNKKWKTRTKIWEPASSYILRRNTCTVTVSWGPCSRTTNSNAVMWAKLKDQSRLSKQHSREIRGGVCIGWISDLLHVPSEHIGIALWIGSMCNTGQLKWRTCWLEYVPKARSTPGYNKNPEITLKRYICGALLRD